MQPSRLAVPALPVAQGIGGAMNGGVQHTADIFRLNHINAEAEVAVCDGVPKAHGLRSAGHDVMEIGADLGEDRLVRDLASVFVLSTLFVDFIPEAILVFIALHRVSVKLVANGFHVSFGGGDALVVLGVPHAELPLSH